MVELNKMNLDRYLPTIKKNVPLAKYTTFKIGGKARYFFIAKTKKDLIKAISFAKKLKLPFVVLGGGSNVLVSDKGYKGLVIQISNFKLQITNYRIVVEAGVLLSKLVNVLAKKGLSGLEWAAGIPGATIGGAIYGNAGAFGKSMKDSVEKVEILDIKNLRIKNLKNKDCKFGYRESIFKKKKNLIILSAIFKFKKEKKEKIRKLIEEYLSHRRTVQPLNHPSAGSVFKNPAKKGLTAGRLIEECGLRGKKNRKGKNFRKTR
jgi:UDP-N-acetylmuramate dehydrogenase